MDSAKDVPAPFDPRDPQYRGRLWVRVVDHQKLDNDRHHVYWLRVVVALLGLLVVGWYATAAAAWTYVKYGRGYDDASYMDLVLFPWRGAEFRAGLAHFYAARGESEMEKKNYAEGYLLLRAGLARLPGDLAVRRSVARWELRFGLPFRALQTLEGGAMLAGHDLDYLKIMFALLFEAKGDDRALEIAKELLPAKPEATLVYQYIALQKATAHFNRGRYTEAEGILAQWSLLKSVEGVILQARCDWERGYPLLALVRLESEIPRFPRRDELFLELINLNQKLGRFDEARRMAVLRNLNDPHSPGPRVSLMQAYRSSGEAAAEQRELEGYLQEFQADPRALTLLAWHAMDTLQPALMERVCELARQQKFPLRAFNLARIELALALEHYQQALTLASEALTETFEPGDSQPTYLRALRALAQAGLGDVVGGELELRSFKRNTRLRPDDLLLLGRHLRMLGLSDLARAFFEQAVNFDSLNEKALAELVRMDASANFRVGLTANLPKLLRFPKPPRAVLEEALLRLNEPADQPLRADVVAAMGRLPAALRPRRRRSVRGATRSRLPRAVAGREG